MVGSDLYEARCREQQVGGLNFAAYGFLLWEGRSEALLYLCSLIQTDETHYVVPVFLDVLIGNLRVIHKSEICR